VALGALLAVGLTLAAWQGGWISRLHSFFHPDQGGAIDISPAQTPAASQPAPTGVQTVGTESPTPTAEADSQAAKKIDGTQEPTAQQPPAQQPSSEQASPTPPPTAASTPTETREPPLRRPVVKARRILTAVQQQQIRSWFRQAEQYMSRGQYNEAAFALKQVLQIDPDNQKAKEGLLRIRKELGRGEGSGSQ
jgi:hypothetical protein